MSTQELNTLQRRAEFVLEFYNLNIFKIQAITIYFKFFLKSYMYYLDLVTLDDNKRYQTKINSLFFARQAHTDDETI